MANKSSNVPNPKGMGIVHRKETKSFNLCILSSVSMTIILTESITNEKKSFSAVE